MFTSIEFWSFVVSAVLSVIAIVQSAMASKASKNANELAVQANEISREAKVVSQQANEISKRDLEENEKNNYAILKFDGGIVLEEKDFEELCNEVTLDFDKALFDDEMFHYDSMLGHCICTKVKHIGKGLVTKIKVDRIQIFSGNLVTATREYQGENRLLYFRDECSIEREVVLEPDETINLNILMTEVTDADEKDWECVESAIKGFMEKYDNIIISMHLVMTSLNRSEYKQDLTGVFLRGKLQSNAFSECRKG